MKKIFYLMIGLATYTASAQVGVGVSSANVDASAQFEVASTNKGFLAPRMSEAQKNDIASPAAGLLVYQTDGTTGFYYYDGSAWKSGLGIQGLKGDTGLTGETGAKGATGETGPQGLQGIQGAQGETGAKGATGETGPQGLQGIQGKSGGLAWNNDRGYAAGEVVIYKGNTYICLLYNDGEPGNIVPLNTTYFAPYSLVGLKGEQGPQGEMGLTGLQGPQGPQGVMGEMGSQGLQGLKGEQGPQGIQGKSGEIGAIGEQGIQGVQGEKGDQGPAGTPADLSNYATTSSLTTETERAQNAEETLTTSVSDLSNIVSQIAIPDLSDYVTTSKLENVHYSLGQNYDELNSLIDEQKDKSTSLTTSVNVLTTNVESLQTSVQDLMAAGTQGPQGIQGAQGETGAKGTTGETGPQGIQGAQGETGAKGTTGETGPQGIQGAQGETGAKGATGETGPQGLQGIQGKSGGLAWNNDRGYVAGEVVVYEANTYICLLNNDGEPGTIVPLNTTYFAPYSLVGPKGDQGIQGEKGDTGAIGEQGIQGKKGDMGEKGEQGPEGIQGAQGETGAKGTTGETGPQGPAGSDAFKISTNNPNAIHNVNLGNVGIGTENPSYKIDIVGENGPRLRVYSQDNYWAGILAENSTHQYFMGVQHAGESANGTNSGFHIYDNTVGARRMVIDATGNMGIGVSEPTEKLVVAGNIKSNQSVMANSFVKADGTAAQYLMADGSVSTSTGGGATVNEAADEFTAETSQSSFTLTQTPAATSRVKMYINGIRISNGAYGVNGTTVTYFPDYNGAYVITANDRIQFDYSY